MYIINKELDQIIREDLQELIDNGVIEAKNLEYKSELPGNTDSEKKEFLADVSSFANASGGDIIYGISTDKDTGKPLPLEGFCIQNAEQETLRLGNIIQYGVEPKISSVDIKPIELPDSKYAIIVRVSRSWNKPHRIKFQDNHKFWIRRSNSKDLMDIPELKTMFNLSDTLAERIRKFREERISSIIADETFITLGDNPKIVLHLIPLISFELGQKYDLSIVRADPSKIRPIDCNAYDYRYNVDGFLTHRITKEYGIYTQIYRNGIVEAVNTVIISQPSFSNIRFERGIIESLAKYFFTMRELFIETPIVLFISLLDVNGYKMDISNRFFLSGLDCYPIDRDNLLLSEVTIENYDEPADKILRPCFDSIWNACGLKRDFNYDENGNWK